LAFLERKNLDTEIETQTGIFLAQFGNAQICNSSRKKLTYKAGSTRQLPKQQKGPI
jgi:hypothetical protein